MCQKVINVLAVASAAVSVAVVGSGLYVFVNKDAIIQDVTEKALGGLTGGLDVPDLGGGSLPVGANDLSPTAPQASAPDAPSAGLGTPTF